MKTDIIGRVVDEQGKPISKAMLKVSYDEPVFQDIVIAYTDEDGKFDVVANLEQLIPIFGNIVVALK